MKKTYTTFKSESEGMEYYIKYSIDDTVLEFWADNEEDYNDMYNYVVRHIGHYKLLDKREPIC